MSDQATETGCAVLRPSERPRADRGGGASTVQLVTPGCGSTSMLNGITTIPPGGAIPLHTHNCEESVLVLGGDAIAEMGGVEYRLDPLDTTFIPEGVPHRFRNASTTEPLRIFWTYARIDATRTLVETGETRTIAAEHAKAKG